MLSNSLKTACAFEVQCAALESDPEFSFGGGANSQTGCANLFFPENCIEIKQFGQGVGGFARQWRPSLRSKNEH